MEIKSISSHKQIIPADKNQKNPVEFFVAPELLPDDFTINQLKNVAADPHVSEKVVALADVHQKKGRKNPSGSVVACENFFLPQLIDTAPNCGMRLITTPFDESNLTTKQIDKLFEEFIKVIPTNTPLGTYLPLKTIIDISLNGTRALLEYLGENPKETENTLFEGNMLGNEIYSEKELFGAIPKIFFRAAQLRLGILGAAGNHFLDLLKITDIINPEIAQKWNLHQNQYVFLMHTGSGLFGQYASYFYTPKQKEHFSQKIALEIGRFLHLEKKVDWHQIIKKDIPEFKNKKEFFAINKNSDLGKNYYLAHRAAGNHGFANRTLLQYNIKKTIEKTLGIKNPDLRLLYDMSHVYAQKENHFGKELVIHRNNASRAFGPARMQNHQIFGKTGEPIFLPSSMSTPAFICAGLDANDQTFFSAPHGTGRIKNITDKKTLDKKELFAKMETRGVKLYNAKSKGIVGQDADFYKNVDTALDGLTANNIAKPVAKMIPVAVLMA